MKIACPFCGGHIEFDLVDAGREAACPHCGREIRLASGEDGTQELRRDFGPPPLPRRPIAGGPRPHATPPWWRFRLFSERSTPAWAIGLLIGLVVLGMSIQQAGRSQEAAQGIVSFLGALLGVGLVAGIYLAPYLVAVQRRHRQCAPIFIVNLFLGWTLVGWVGALAWAFWSAEPAHAERGGKRG